MRLRWCRPNRYYKLSKWRGTFSQDGGALSNQGMHLLDLLSYLTGEVSEINVIMKTFGAKIYLLDIDLKISTTRRTCEKNFFIFASFSFAEFSISC